MVFPARVLRPRRVDLPRAGAGAAAVCVCVSPEAGRGVLVHLVYTGLTQKNPGSPFWGRCGSEAFLGYVGPVPPVPAALTAACGVPFCCVCSKQD